jgi:hypothetical protein
VCHPEQEPQWRLGESCCESYRELLAPDNLREIGLRICSNRQCLADIHVVGRRECRAEDLILKASVKTGMHRAKLICRTVVWQKCLFDQVWTVVTHS